MKQFPLLNLDAYLIVASTLLLPSSLCNSHPLDVGKGEPLISKICWDGWSPDNGLCLSTLQFDPRSTTENATELAIIVLDRLETEAKETARYIEKLSRSTTDTITRRYLDGCIREYDLLVGKSIPAMRRALDVKAYVSAPKLATDACRNVDICEEAFTKNLAEKRESPISDRNVYIKMLSKVAAGIVIHIET